MVKDLFLNKAQMKLLVEKGLDISHACFWINPQGNIEQCNGLWQEYTGKFYKVKYYEFQGISPYLEEGEYMPVFCLQEILDKLPKMIMHNGNHYKLASDFNNQISYIGTYDICLCEFIGNNLLDAAYKALNYCIDNKYILINN